MGKNVEMEPLATQAVTDTPAPAKAERIDGVVVGVLAGLDAMGVPLVAFPGNPSPDCIPARATASLGTGDVGREVALLFEGGDPSKPLIVGCIEHPERTAQQEAREQLSAELDGRRVMLSASEEIVLRCGKASITLTRAGKILLRGTYLLSRSSGVNRIKGGSVQLN